MANVRLQARNKDELSSSHLPTQNLLLNVSMTGMARMDSPLLLLENDPKHLFDIASFAFPDDFC